MKIFVGSRTEKQDIAESIVKLLQDAGHDPVPWYDHNVFPAGSVTLKALIDLSEKCNGAVIIFGEDDEIFDPGRNFIQKLFARGKTVYVPRDNVLIEYGIFVAKHGADKTLVYKEELVKKTSDLDGITYVTATDYITKIPASFQIAGDRSSGRSVATRIVLHVSTELADLLQRGTIPEGWFSRAMYIGSRGAEAWAGLEGDSSYAGRGAMNAVADSIQRLAKAQNVTNTSCVVSFGPGLGLLDKAILPNLLGTAPAKYIPIDLNDHLAMRAAAAADQITYVSVPFCIVADFEKEMNTIKEIIREHTTSKRVFIMLGGTFGNIETDEAKFLGNLADCMEKDDTAIFDVSIATSSYLDERDPYRHLSSTDTKTKSTVRFLAAGVERRTGIPASTVASAFTKHVGIREATFGSSIPSTKSFEFYCIDGGEPLINIKRFNLDKFKEYLQGHGFNVIAVESVGSPSAALHRGVFFIRKRCSNFAAGASTLT
jgi:hypothetical protein